MGSLQERVFSAKYPQCTLLVSRLRQLLHRTMLRAEIWILVLRKEAPLSIFSWQVFVFILLTSGAPVAKRNFGIQQPSAISEIYFFIKALGHQTSDLRTNQYCLLHILKLPSDTIEKIRFSEIRSPAN